MDANGTTFHLLLGEDDWGSCTTQKGQVLRLAWKPEAETKNTTGLEWNRERSELTLQSRLSQFIAARQDNPPKLTDRRGAGRDRYGNWYWIDKNEREILVNSSGTGKTSHFWSSTDIEECEHQQSFGGFQPKEPKTISPSLRLGGLSITEDHYLVVGVLEPKGVLIFDLHSGGQPRQLNWPESVPFVPFDMSPRPGGGVFILDRQNKCYWTLDRYLNVIKKDHHTTNTSPPAFDFQECISPNRTNADERIFPSAITIDASSHINADDPIAIESLPDATVLILDHNPNPLHPFSLIYRYSYEEQVGPAVSTEVMSDLIEDDTGEPFSLIAHDFAFVPEHDKFADRLYVVAANGNQTFAFNIAERHGALELFPLADFLPMRLFGGKGLVNAGAQPFYDFNDSWIPLVEQKRPRFVPEAILLTPLGEVRPAFDGKEPDCVWHRLMIDGCMPPEAEVQVWSRAANDVRDLAQAEWQPEPSLYLRGDGSEQPFAWKATGSRNSTGSTLKTTNKNNSGPRDKGTWELLFQRARGRYLQLKLKLSGNGRTTPRLRSLRAYYPRFSYLTHYMPALYREDDNSASFLDRFLANLEGFYTTLEDKIAAVQALFDIYGAPPEALEWLANWFGVALDPAWDNVKRRLFIKHVMDFFQYRGTIRGLLMALRLAFDECADESIFTDIPSATIRNSRIRIIEKFRTRRTPGLILGDPTSTDGPRQVLQANRWLPSSGVEELNRRYRQAAGLKGTEPYPITDPGGNRSTIWQQFSNDTLGFVPASTANERQAWQRFLSGQYVSIQALNADFGTSWTRFDEIPLPDDKPPVGPPLDQWNEYLETSNSRASALNRRLWQDYLARRYQRVTALNSAYRANWPGFETVSLPNDVPADGPPLQDWYQFESVVLTMHRSAHRFTVMLPVPKGDTGLNADHQQQLELTRRIVNLEKPTHTIFDMKFYWDMFRIGEARLGTDTLIDYGSRSPQLMPPMVLDQGYLAGGYLSPRHPQDVTDRQILGCEQLQASPQR